MLLIVRFPGVFSSKQTDVQGPQLHSCPDLGEVVASVIMREEDKGAERSALRPHNSPVSP